MSKFLMHIKHILALAWKCISANALFCPNCPIFWTEYCTFCVYQSGPTINEILANASNKDGLCFRWWLRYRVWIQHLKFQRPWLMPDLLQIKKNSWKRTLAKLAGKIITTKYVLGDITRATWDKKFNINNYKKNVLWNSALEIWHKKIK